MTQAPAQRSAYGRRRSIDPDTVSALRNTPAAEASVIDDVLSDIEGALSMLDGEKNLDATQIKPLRGYLERAAKALGSLEHQRMYSKYEQG